MYNKLGVLLTALILAWTTARQPVFSADAAHAASPTPPPPPPHGVVMRAADSMADTYEISLTKKEGVRPRDIYAVKRAGKIIGEVMVFSVGTSSSLVTPTKKQTPLLAKDEVVFVRHADVPATPRKMPTGEPAIIKGVDVDAHGYSMPGGGGGGGGY